MTLTKLDPSMLSALTATGGTATATLAARFGHALNVADDFGATGDGVTDDTAAFTAMAAAGGGYVPPGTYKLGSSVTTPSGCRWIIDPAASIIGVGAGSLNLERGFWTDQGNGANVHRLNDRVLIGDATVIKGAYSNGVNKSWVGYEANGYLTYFDSRSQLASYSTIGGVAISAASRTSDNPPSDPQPCIGIATYARTSAADQTAWGAYLSARRDTGAKNCFAVEADIANTGASVISTAYNAAPTGVSAAAWLRSGGETSESGITTGNASVAIGIVRDATGAGSPKFEKGIVFQASAINGADGTTGTGVAIEMGLGHEIRWTYDGTGAAGAYVRSDTSAAATGLVFTSGGPQFVGPNGKTAFSVFVPASSVNRLSAFASVSGTAVSLNAAGDDTNISITITPKGTGGVRINSGNVNIASGTILMNSTQVLTARKTGWTAMTGTATRTTVATGSATLADVAERLKAVIDDLVSHGLLGS